jgi:hypothetical protein
MRYEDLFRQHLLAMGGQKNAPVIILRRPMRPKLHRDDLCAEVYHVKKICQEIFKLITKGAGEFGQSVIFY